MEELSPLPTPVAHVKLQLLDGGNCMMPAGLIIDKAPMTPYKGYDWVIYIHHPTSNRHILWDVGMVADVSQYTPGMQGFLNQLHPNSPEKPLQLQLDQLGIGAHDIDTVLFSHAHWDHCRPIKKLFPNAKSYFGPGTTEYCSPGHLKSPECIFDAAFFDPELATENWAELSGPWVPFGAFERATDFFGDGSLWLVDAPGHMPGNLFAAAHIGNGEWVILGGDCCHSRSILDGTDSIAEFSNGKGGKSSMHHDLPVAKETILKIRQMEKTHGLHVVLAHDETWLRTGTDTVLMSLLTEDTKILQKKIASE